MSHRVNPKIFRLKKNSDWDSRWMSKKKFPEYLEEDFKIRRFLKKELKEAGIEKVEIDRFSDKINIIILTARPGLIIGRGGQGVEKLRNELMSKVFKEVKERVLKIEIKGVRDPWVSAALSGQWVARQLEQRVPFRRVIKRALSKIMSHKDIKGARIQVAGRLNGAEIARTEWLKEGQLPRQTIRADIDYSEDQAFCSYGVIGVKVWLYKGEKF